MHVVQPAGWQGDVKRISALTLAATRDSILAADLATHEEIDAILAQLDLAARDDTVVTAARIARVGAGNSHRTRSHLLLTCKACPMVSAGT